MNGAPTEGGGVKPEAMPSEERPRIVLVNRCFIKDHEGRILLLRRSQNEQHNAGLWEPPGGKLDEGQDLSNALEREVLEESNLIIEPTADLVYALSTVLTQGKYKGLPYVVLFSIAELAGGRIRLSDEHEAHAWTTYDEALSYDMTHESYKALVKLRDRLQPVD